MEPNPLIDMRDLQGRRDLITPQSSQRAIIVPSKQSILITPTKLKILKEQASYFYSAGLPEEKLRQGSPITVAERYT